MQMKFRITKIDEELFFLKLGEVVVVDYDKGRIYSEDEKQYVTLDLALKFGVDGEQVE